MVNAKRSQEVTTGLCSQLPANGFLTIISSSGRKCACVCRIGFFVMINTGQQRANNFHVIRLTLTDADKKLICCSPREPPVSNCPSHEGSLFGCRISEPLHHRGTADNSINFLHFV